jgi:ribosomal protein L19E
MRIALLVLACLCPLGGIAGERCIAIDGDTLVCNHQKVRLTNVYAAELNEAGGRAAKRRLQTLIASGEVALHPFGHDRYGRTLAEVYVNGRRIEQADIGPRAGRGARWHSDRHYFANTRKVRYPHVQAYPMAR